MEPRDHPDSSKENPTNSFELKVIYCFNNAFSIPIPKSFQRSFGGLFQSCLICGISLYPEEYAGPGNIDSQYPLYLVLKEIHRGEPWVEYALCWDCLTTLQDSYTSETTDRINKLFEARVDPKGRFHNLTMAGAQVEAWIEKCVLTGELVQPDTNHHMVAACRGKSLVLSFLPYAIAGQGLKMFEACFDEATKKIQNEFCRKYLGVESSIFGEEL